jgi:phosphatidate cytidylyltransferase
LNGAADSTTPERKPARKLGRFELSIDWLWRPLFGIGLAALAVAAAWDGKWFFALFLGAGALAGVREWHRIFLREGYASYFFCSALAIAGALIVQNLTPDDHGLPWALLAMGALFNLAVYRQGTALWHAAGVFYVCAAPLCVLILRQLPDAAFGIPHAGFWLVLAMFLAVWATDTGALIAGNLIGGPKLWPKMSPNKTWAGAFGGAVCAIAATVILFACLHANVIGAALFGLAMSVVGQVGDLFESWIKRRVGRKNSGSLIPGHGGVLDRIDSILFVAPLVTLAIAGFGFNPLGAP